MASLAAECLQVVVFAEFLITENGIMLADILDATRAAEQEECCSKTFSPFAPGRITLGNYWWLVILAITKQPPAD